MKLNPLIVSCSAMLQLLLVTAAVAQTAALPAGAPHLEKQGTATRLIVDGRPFLMIGGELMNSSSSSREHMQKLWPRLAALPMNTVLTPLAWDMIEPVEGRYDFALVDGLLEDARKQHLHLVFLWLASWKNGMSSYPPLWVKKDFARFPRVPDREGNGRELLSTFGAASRDADARAFAALMRHLREVDGKTHTVLMMQVENEVGILNDSRDRSAAANQAYSGPVPAALMDYLQQHKETLIPEFRQIWAAAGGRTAGTWEQVFGAGPGTDEIFMAWNYARYVGHVAAAGKGEYAIPMYANCWLSQPYFLTPGTYPSGGPLAYLVDVWRAGAPAIDLLAPDLYGPNFIEWCEKYPRSGNPFFIPETESGPHGAWASFYAIGQHDAMGFSPFGIDLALDRGGPELGRSYAVLQQLAPVILEHQGLGHMTGFQLTKEHPAVTATLGGYELEISLDSIFGHSAEQGYGMIIATGPDEFVGAGTGFMVKFKPVTPGLPLAGFGGVVEGTYQDGKWVPGRHLNGDETDQGLHWRFNTFTVGIQHCTAYRHR